jgi:hypothetical protein
VVDIQVDCGIQGTAIHTGLATGYNTPDVMGATVSLHA